MSGRLGLAVHITGPVRTDQTQHLVSQRRRRAVATSLATAAAAAAAAAASGDR